MKTVVFVTNIPAHYRVALIKLASRKLLKKNIKLITLFSRLSYGKRDYWNIKETDLDFDFKIVQKKNSVLVKNKLFEIGFETIKEVKKIKPDLLILVGFSIQSFLLSKHCLKANIPYILYSGETKNTAEVYEKNPVRKILRRSIIKNATGFFVYCEKAKEYIEGFKRKSDEIDVVINSIDTNSFISKLNGLEEAKDIVCKILFVGDLLKLKGIEFLIRAYSLLDEETKKVSSLIIGGGGEEHGNLLKIISQNNLKNVIITGKLNYEDTVKYFKECDVFVLPSVRERFGLVLQEAACAGKPLIGSIYSGGSFELIEENKNGFIINPENTEDFSSKLKLLIRNEKIRKEFGARSFNIVKEKVNIDVASDSFSKSVIKYLNVQAN